MLKFTEDEVRHLVGIGFCQPRFYKPSVWRKAKRLMDNIVCPNGLAFPFDFGRGKGKYESDFSIEEVKSRTIEILEANENIVSS